MYYQNYEDYMKNVLGNNNQIEYVNSPSRQMYPYNYVPTYTQPIEVNPVNNFNAPNIQNQQPLNVTRGPVMQTSETIPVNTDTSNTNNEVARIKRMYPEIYVILKPMIEKTVNENSSREITEEVINEMTNKVYEAVEEDMSISPRQVSNNSINTENKSRNINQAVQVSAATSTSAGSKISARRPNNRPGNPTLRDLIRILIINRILDNFPRNHRPPRPPQRPDNRPPMIPPMPRQSYPTMNYFQTPYPEDEYYIG